MSDASTAKLLDQKGFIQTVRELATFFERADRQRLEQAFKAGDLKAVCSALQVSQERLTALLQDGAVEAGKAIKADPNIVVEAVKEHTANGPRP